METQHIAGAMQPDGTQACVRCGALVSDDRNAAWPEGPSAPTGWPEDAAVDVDGPRSSTVPLSGGGFRSCAEG